MRSILVLILLTLVVSCTQTPDEQLALLNGYWEIAQVETADGIQKEYGISQNIDFIEINGSKGIRKKLQPDLSGNFKTNAASENIDVTINDNTVTLTYTTAFDSWSEEIVSIDQTHLTVVNEEGTTYRYRRYQPLLLD